VFKHLDWIPDAEGEAVTMRLRKESALTQHDSLTAAGSSHQAVMRVDSATLLILREVVRKTLPELHGF
jgi:hypothetical protein